MKKLHKLIITTSLLSASALHAVTFEYPSLYKDPRVMGMGGANVAVGGEASALFSNPAGLSTMNPDEGFEVDLLNINVAFSENTLDLIDAMDAATSTTETLAVLEKYQGSNNHLSFNNFSSLSYRGDEIAFSLGALAGTQFNFQTHALGSPAGLLDANGYILTGLVTGISYDWDDDLHIGVGAKILSGKSMSAALTLSQVLSLTSGSSDSSSYLEDNYMQDFDTTTFDAGLIYDAGSFLSFIDDWDPSLGLSVLDIGDTELGLYGTIPMTVNVGFSVKPDFPILSDWVFALDYIDLLNAYDDDYDADTAKKIRLGAKASLIDDSIIKLSGSLGLYNANPTYGLEFRFSVVSVVFSSFSEAIGAYADQELDRRYNLSIALGW